MPTVAHVNKLLQVAGLVPGKPGAKSEMKRVTALKELLDIGYGKVR